MKRILLLVLVVLAGQLVAQTTHTVTVGGGGSAGTPFYDPQFLTIQVGDQVNWEWVSGFHTVTTTTAPESFSLGPMAAPWLETRVFTVEGVYEYECTVGTHASTQFGSITVTGTPSSVDTQEGEVAWSIYPNPAQSEFRISNVSPGTIVTLFNIAGAMVKQFQVNADPMTLNVSDLPVGCYIVSLENNTRITRKKLVIH